MSMFANQYSSSQFLLIHTDFGGDHYWTWKILCLINSFSRTCDHCFSQNIPVPQKSSNVSDYIFIDLAFWFAVSNNSWRFRCNGISNVRYCVTSDSFNFCSVNMLEFSFILDYGMGSSITTKSKIYNNRKVEALLLSGRLYPNVYIESNQPISKKFLIRSNSWITRAIKSQT